MKKRNITLVFNHFEREHFGKDVFLVPYSLGKIMKYDVTIVYPLTEGNKNFPQYYRGVRLFPVKLRGSESSNFLYRELNLFIYIIKNSRKIDVLIRFHNSLQTKLSAIIYKIIRPSGKLYVKLDINEHKINLVRNYGRILKKVYNCITRLYIKCCDVFSCETQEVYELINKSIDIEYALQDKLLIVQNGFDEDALREMNLREMTYNQKSNIFITVGRLGTFPKNTDLILRALPRLDMQNWKFMFVGPIEPSFKDKIEKFYKEFPEFVENVVFTGPIYDKEKLWSLYNESKVFVLSSRSEGFAMVFGEAKRFRNFIVTTHVGGSDETIESGKYGFIYTQDNDIELSNVMQDIINGKLNVDVYGGFRPESLSWSNQLSPVAAILKNADNINDNKTYDQHVYS